MTEEAQIQSQVSVADGVARIVEPAQGTQAPPGPGPGQVQVPEARPAQEPPKVDELSEALKAEMQRRGISADKGGLQQVFQFIDAVAADMEQKQVEQARQQQAAETQTAQGQVKARILEPVDKILATAKLPDEIKQVLGPLFKDLLWANADSTLRMAAGITQAEVKKAKDAAAAEWREFRKLQTDPRYRDLMPVADQVLEVAQTEGLQPEQLARILSKFPQIAKPAPKTPKGPDNRTGQMETGGGRGQVGSNEPVDDHFYDSYAKAMSEATNAALKGEDSAGPSIIFKDSGYAI